MPDGLLRQNAQSIRNRRMPNGTYGGVRGRKTKVGRKLSFSSYSICAPLCSCVAVPWRCRSGCVSCIVLRGGCVAVTLRRGCVSLCFGPLRFVPGGLVPFRVVVPCRAGPLRTGFVLRRAQNRHFCALFGFGTPIFRPFEHKIGVFVSEWAIFRDFWSF